MLRYAITDRTFFQGNESARQDALVAQAARWAEQGIGQVQLREKELEAGALAALARRILEAIEGTSTQLLINHRLDVALAVGAHGVHLTAAQGELTPQQVRRLWPEARITVSCHTLEEARRAAQPRAAQPRTAQPRTEQPRTEQAHADAIVFAPVFEKPLPGQPPLPGLGLERLRAVAASVFPTPVYALGGVTDSNARLCIEAGAAGVAGIRLFHTL